MNRPPRIGIFGGTFDPPHRGHLIIARAAVRQLQLDALFLVPARIAPHKRDRKTAAARHRLAMTRALVQAEKKMKVSAIEIRRAGVSFTVDTIAAFRKRFPTAELFLVLGADNVQDFHRWHHPAKIRAEATIAVYPRKGSRRPSGAVVLKGRLVSLSSTDVRERYARGADIRSMVTAAVFRIIRKHSLYSA